MKEVFGMLSGSVDVDKRCEYAESRVNFLDAP